MFVLSEIFRIRAAAVLITRENIVDGTALSEDEFTARPKLGRAAKWEGGKKGIVYERWDEDQISMASFAASMVASIM